MQISEPPLFTYQIQEVQDTMENNNKKKEFLSEPIWKELRWIKDIQDKETRQRLRDLDHSISLTYTYFVYHDYTVKELAKIFNVKERQIVFWILMGAYIVDGGMDYFGDGTGVGKYQWIKLMGRYPKDKETLPCHRCVWADTRTGRVICFRNCKGFNCFQSK